MSAGWYTVETSKSGVYITSTFNVYACGDISGGDMSGGDISGQDTSISTILDTGAMRIVLSWKTTDDLDGHLTGPDNLSGQGHSNAAHEQFHLWYPEIFRNFYYATNNFSYIYGSFVGCSGCSVSQISDNVTLDLDSPSAIGSDGGPETITIAAVRSGTYRYYVHNFTNKGQQNHMGLYKSKASVKVYHSSLSGGLTKFKAPNKAGDLWTVFEFNNSSGVTRIRTVGSETSSANVDTHGSSVTDGIGLMGGAIQGRELSLSTAVTTLAGSSQGSTDHITGTSASFNYPRGITTDGTNLYVADT